jgi:cellulose synthase (UDP-forming)
MNAKLLLQLWRERWGKGHEGQPNQSYVRGSIFQWAEKFPTASAWATPGVSVAIILAALSFFLLSISIEFTLNGQISFAGLMVMTALFLRRYDGHLISLTLVCLALLCAGQYFVWRFGTTLLVHSDASFFARFVLCSVELLVVFYLVIGWIARLWPIEQDEAELHSLAKDLPSIDVLLLATSLEKEQVLKIAKACSAMVWPTKKLKLHVVDGQSRVDLERSLLGLGAAYWGQQDPSQALEDCTAALHRGLAKGQADMILVLDQSCLPSKHFLERTLGWLENDPGLAMLYSAGHCLAPKLAQEMIARQGTAQLGPDQGIILPELSFALVRRECWDKEGRSIASKSAAVFERQATGTDDLFASSSKLSRRFIRVDRADSNRSLMWKRRILQLRKLLHFYRAVAYSAFLIAPLAFLLQGITLVHAKHEWFACYAIPALILMSVCQARRTHQGRWAELKELKELALSAYMLAATSVSYLKTALVRPHLVVVRWLSDLSPAQWLFGLLITLILVLNLAAVPIGLAQLFVSNAVGPEWTLGYTIWALVNATLLLSRQAILQESSQIKRFSAQKQKLSAMIKLPYGRTMACKTVNFPCAELALNTPIPFDCPIHSDLELSIFHNRETFRLTVQALRTEGLTTYVRLSGTPGAELNPLRDAVLARGNDWPMWLPKRDADQPLPLWLSNFLAAVPVKLLDMSMNLSKLFRLDTLKQLWKTKK